jgi:hypothetical protein
MRNLIAFPVVDSSHSQAQRVACVSQHTHILLVVYVRYYGWPPKPRTAVGGPSARNHYGIYGVRDEGREDRMEDGRQDLWLAASAPPTTTTTMKAGGMAEATWTAFYGRIFRRFGKATLRRSNQRLTPAASGPDGERATVGPSDANRSPTHLTIWRKEAEVRPLRIQAMSY